ncbi:beta-glucanase [Cladorrhinum sp. PSN259]|nr:beta-glucanase [Cladorrhinum sp. PSN259]
MKTLISLPISLLFFFSSLSLSQAQSLTDDSKCGCYLLKSTNDTHFFTEHRFFDFRSLSQYAGVPPAIRDYQSSASAEMTSNYFTTSTWTDFWMLGSWNNSGGIRQDATVNMTNSPNNVYIESLPNSNPPSTFLTLRTQRMQSFQTAAEIESASAKFQFLSMRMSARTIGAKGAITAMFTYRDSSTLAKVQESDLEIRTSDPPNLIHYTNQPSYTDSGDVVPQATKNSTMPSGLNWSDWAVHRLDWTPHYTVWYVNDIEVAKIDFQTPKDVSNIILNSWSDGGKWTGNMTLWDAAYLQVQWFEIVYNTTEEKGSKMIRNSKAKKDGGSQGNGNGQCGAVCSVDGTSQLGKPVMLWNNGAAGKVADAQRGLLVSVFMGLVVFLLI